MSWAQLDGDGLSAQWPAPATVVAPAVDTVVVWRARLDLPAAEVARLWATLSPAERGRADVFALGRDRRRFIAARGLLRTLLGRCLGLAPGDVPLTADRRGKLALVSAMGGGDLRFNLAHSGDLALYAVARGREVGVDVERIRDDVDWEAVAAQFFAPAEIIALWSLPAAARREAFFRCWTRKEAYLKARGEGVTRALDRFAVTLAPGEPACIVTSDGAPGGVDWSLRSLEVGPRRCAAVAAAGRDWRLVCSRWPAAVASAPWRSAPRRYLEAWGSFPEPTGGRNRPIR